MSAPSSIASMAVPDDEAESQRNLHNSRSRNGCHNCRAKKVKCDEARPHCQRCVRLDRNCDYTPRIRKQYTKRRPTAATIEKSTGVQSVTTISSTYEDTLAPELAVPTAISPTTTRTNEAPDSLAFSFGSPLSCGSSSLESSLSPTCASIVSQYDQNSIQFFRSVLTAAVDTKVPEHSGPAIVWVLAQRSPMVLHMVCALGAGKMTCGNSVLESEIQNCRSKAAEHYGAGLSLLAAATQNTIETSDFDNILATLWLMIVYEQRHGDGCGTGLVTHLQGAASLLQGRLRNLRAILERKGPQVAGRDADTLHPDMKVPSSLTTRMIVWISMIDGGASLTGIGGVFSDLLGEAMFDLAKDAALSRLKGFALLHSHSNLVYQEMWGAAYPQSQQIENLQSGELFALYAESGQLRFMLGKLANEDRYEDPQLEADKSMVAAAIEDVEIRYSELISVADSLDLPPHGSQRRFVSNIRFIVPFYHAIVLCFLRMMNGPTRIGERQRDALRGIMALAFKAYNDEGDQAMARLGWPLFVAALESDDIIHRNWILERYDALAREGENYRRAREALRVTFVEQKLHERRVDYLDLVRRGAIDRFVI